MYQLILLIMTFAFNKSLIVKSPGFADNGMIPDKYTCVGTNFNPGLEISGIPDDAKSLALVMDDPDAPSGTFDHWIVWNIPVSNKIEENSVPGTEGKNGKGESKYTGPCPPNGTHHYQFKVYALDTRLDLPSGTDKQALMDAMEKHIVAKGKLVGLFKK